MFVRHASVWITVSLHGFFLNGLGGSYALASRSLIN